MMSLVERKGFRFIETEEQYFFFEEKTNEEIIDFIIKSACSVIGKDKFADSEDFKVADYNICCAMEYLFVTRRGKAKKNMKMLKQAFGEKISILYSNKLVCFTLEVKEARYIFFSQFKYSDVSYSEEAGEEVEYVLPAEEIAQEEAIVVPSKKRGQTIKVSEVEIEFERICELYLSEQISYDEFASLMKGLCTPENKAKANQEVLSYLIRYYQRLFKSFGM